MVLVHLAAEVACAKAVRREIARQFREQFPDRFLTLDVDISLTEPEDFSVKVNGFNVELVQP